MKIEKETAINNLYNKSAENYAKFAAAVWVLYGIYAIFAHKLEGNFVSLFIFISLYFSIGSAFAALASIVPYLPMYGLNRLCDKARNVVLSIFAILVNYLSWVVVVLWTIFLANWIIGFNNNLF